MWMPFDNQRWSPEWSHFQQQKRWRKEAESFEKGAWVLLEHQLSLFFQGVHPLFVQRLYWRAWATTHPKRLKIDILEINWNPLFSRPPISFRWVEDSLLGWFPLKSLPTNFRPKKLVELKMPASQLEHVWNQHPVCFSFLFLIYKI